MGHCVFFCWITGVMMIGIHGLHVGKTINPRGMVQKAAVFGEALPALMLFSTSFLTGPTYSSTTKYMLSTVRKPVEIIVMWVVFYAKHHPSLEMVEVYNIFQNDDSGWFMELFYPHCFFFALMSCTLF